MFNKLKRKLYLNYLKKNNPIQYKLEYKYSPERAQSIPNVIKKRNTKQWFKNNILAIIDLIIALAGLAIAIISLIK